MDGAVAQAVLACLGDGASPRQLLARIDDLAARAEAPARVPDELADALLGVVLAGRPPPALALAYLREACAGAHLGYAAGAAVDASVVLAALLRRDPAPPPAAAELVCGLLLEATDGRPDVAWAPLLGAASRAELAHASAARAAAFWVRLLALALAGAGAPRAPPSVLLVDRLVRLAEAARWPLGAPVEPRARAELAARIAALREQAKARLADGDVGAHAAWKTLLHRLTTLERATLHEREPSTLPADDGTLAAVLPGLWGNEEHVRALLDPLHPHAGALEPEVVVLVHRLAGAAAPWETKCAEAHALLQARTAGAQTAEAQADARFAFYVELLAGAAAAGAGSAQGDVQPGATLARWRHVLCGLLPALLYALEAPAAAVGTHPEHLVLADALTAFLRTSDALQQYEALEQANAPPAAPVRDTLLHSLAAWGLVQVHGAELRPAPPLQAQGGVPAAPPALAAFAAEVDARLADPGAGTPLEALAVRAVEQPALQAVLARRVGAALHAAADAPPEALERTAAVCVALGERAPPGVCDVLLLYSPQASLAASLARLLHRASAEGWQRDPDALETLGRIALLPQLLAAWYGGDGAAAYAFATEAPACVYERSALDADARALLDRWCQVLFGEDGIEEELLGRTPPWTFMLLAPTLVEQALRAHARGLLSRAALHSGLSYFQQPLLSYALPGAVAWLVRQVRLAAACAPAAPSGALCLDVLHALLSADTCPGMVRRTVRERVLDLLADDRLASLGPGAAEHATALVAAMQAEPSPPARSALRLPCTAELLLAAAQREAPASAPRADALRAAVCALDARIATADASAALNAAAAAAPPADAPTSVLRRWLKSLAALLTYAPARGAPAALAFAHAAVRWDAWPAGDAAATYAAALVGAFALARHLPGGPEAVRACAAAAHAPHAAASALLDGAAARRAVPELSEN